MNEISKFLKENKLKEISERFSPVDVAGNLSFKEGLLLSYKLLLNEEMNDYLREYSLNLLEGIRKKFPIEWERDWRNDLFLGDAYYLTLKYKERYEAYKRASLGVAPDSIAPALLVSLAGCYLCPDSPITLDEAEQLLLEATAKEKSIEAVTLLRGISKTKGNIDKFSYWDNVLKKLEKENAYIKNKWPEILNNID